MGKWDRAVFKLHAETERVVMEYAGWIAVGFAAWTVAVFMLGRATAPKPKWPQAVNPPVGQVITDRWGNELARWKDGRYSVTHAGDMAQVHDDQGNPLLGIDPVRHVEVGDVIVFPPAQGGLIDFVVGTSQVLKLW